MTTLAGFIIPSTLTGVLILAVALIILWVIVSFPVYIAGKLITDGKGEYGDAMVATLGGGIVYIIILFGGTFLLTYIIAPDLALAISFILALVAWVAVYSDSFDTSFLGGAAIAIVGWGVLVIMDIILISVFGVAIPKFYPF